MPGIKRGVLSTSLSPQPPSPKTMRMLTPQNNKKETVLTTSEVRESIRTRADADFYLRVAKTATPQPASDFSRKALPLHVNLTHTPPKLPEEGETVVPDDPGHIATFTLVPYTLPTGNGGWRGKGRVRVELLDGEDKTQVEAIVSIRAVVVDNKSSGQGYEAASEFDGGVEGYESDNDDGSL